MIADKVVILDVSSHSGKVDFSIARVRGIDAVIIRMFIYGKTYDPSYFTNWNNSAPHFPVRGVYLNVGARSQCERSLSEIDRQFPTEFPPLGIWLAIESQITGNFANGLWLARELERLNRGIVGIYTAKWVQDRDDKQKAFPELGEFPLWVAHYTSALFPTIPSYWRDYHLWQFSADGNNRGEFYGQSSDDADLSLYRGSKDQFYQWVRVNPERDTYHPLDLSGMTLIELGRLISDPHIHLFFRKG